MAENPINIPPPIANPSGLKHSFNRTNFDLENPNPTGGPINDPKSNYTHKYSGKLGKTYLDEYQEARSNNSSFGTEGTDIKPNNIFKKTGLDIENPKAGTKQGGTGGPNRTNSNNIPGGQYLNIGTSNMFGFYPNLNGVTLKNKSDKPVITTLQQYTPNNTYIDTLRLIPKDEL